MKVGFIGAGAVGTALGCYFKNKKIEITGYFSRTHESAKLAALITNSKAYSSLLELVKSSNIIFVTTPDKAIESVASELAELDIDWTYHIICHVSGSYSSDVFSTLFSKGASAASLHPMLSFAEVDSSAAALEEAAFTLEGKGLKLYDLKALLSLCGNNYTEISVEDKPLYHAAACMISNYMVVILDLGMEMLESIGFTKDSALDITRPLIKSTIDNVFSFGTGKALTGPVSRGDSGTVEKHLLYLSQNESKWLPIYKNLASQTIEMAFREKRIDETTAIKIKEVILNYE